MSRIVTIEDEANILELVSLLLRTEGHDALEARTVVEGLTLIREEAPDLVILDLILGSEDGREVFRAARAAGYAGPVLIMSAYGARAAARELGAEGWVEKPFDADVLLREVSRLLGSTSC